MDKNKQRGLTLVELLVAVVLVVIVTLGTAGFSVSMGRLQRASRRQTLSTIEAESAMVTLRKAALQTVGDNNDRGIYSLDKPAINMICFRHAANDIFSYDDDVWWCFGVDSSNDLWACDPIDAPLPVPMTWSQCGSKTHMIGLSDRNFYDIVEDGSGRLLSVKLSLTLRQDRSSPVHPVNNPEYTLTTEVSPPGQSS